MGVPTFGQKFYGPSLQAFDFFSGYNTRIPWLKTRATIQLNIKNAFNQSRVTAGRFTACHFDFPMRNCTIDLDGKRIVERGRLCDELQ